MFSSNRAALLCAVLLLSACAMRVNFAPPNEQKIFDKPTHLEGVFYTGHLRSCCALGVIHEQAYEGVTLDVPINVTGTNAADNEKDITRVQIVGNQEMYTVIADGDHIAVTCATLSHVTGHSLLRVHCRATAIRKIPSND